MTQQPQRELGASPLAQTLFRLEYPQSLGTFTTYRDVQTCVDALSDNEFPVQNTMIVGTDLKLIERVTGRQTWGRVLAVGAIQGLWLGLFVGLLLMFLPGGTVFSLLIAMLMGVFFFIVWSAVAYAMTGGERDFTSTTATVPMQYELMVEHALADEARRILTEAGLLNAPAAPRAAEEPRVTGEPVPAARASNRPTYGQPAPVDSTEQPGAIHVDPDQPRS